ncbi:hypothetical protein F0562_021006 [Nyssa sinensis]|uniref:SAM domain-containing protein n=1 Tax=Nyssa sinensis TaxID=561372 RepID=A0A5J5BKZ4_9ASTE|nr:hypothetical protein F0562_021006 [Nyssa sinensis]
MYADRVETGTKRSIKERLNGNTLDDSGRRRQIAGKRQRQDDDKWEHDLYDGDEPQISNRRIGAKDLRLKLQKKSVQQATQIGKGSLLGRFTTKKTQQKTEMVDGFLQSLGLEKYSITFQAEEVDMTALVHMTDEDLKALGIPMGPRKKILLALESKV